MSFYFRMNQEIQNFRVGKDAQENYLFRRRNNESKTVLETVLAEREIKGGKAISSVRQ